MVDSAGRNLVDKYSGWTEDLIREDLSNNSYPFAVMMSQISGDYNFSSVIRSANFLGAKEVFYYGNKKFDRRGTVGTHIYSKVNFLSTMDEIKLLKEKYVFVGLENNINRNPINLKDFTWAPNSLILIGEENCGLSDEILDLCDHVVEINGKGSVRSLNAAVAGSIAMYDYIAKV